MSESFTDTQGRVYFPDPTKRYPYRAVMDDRWSIWVADRPMGKVKQDPKGLNQLVDHPIPATPPVTYAEADRLPPGANPWQYKMVSATFGDTLERMLNQQGRAGWEVISISAANGTLTLTGNKIFALMKRPLPLPDPTAEDRPPPGRPSGAPRLDEW